MGSQRATKQNKTYIVYVHTNPFNGKKYVGITSTNIEKRAGPNAKNYKKNVLFYRAIQKYGWDVFEHEIIATGLTLEEAASMERDLIAQYKSNDPRYGYNISSGGESGNAGCTISDEMREKKRKQMSGPNNPCYGKFGKAHPAYGMVCTQETREKLSRALKGRHFTEEQRSRMSEAQRKSGRWAGEKNPMAGKTYGKAPQAKPVICMETGAVFDSIKRAAAEYEICERSIGYVCQGNGRYKTAGGYHWKYYQTS